MAQRITVQDGIIVYATSDPALSVNIDVRGQMNVTKELNVGDDPLADGTITTPAGADLLIAPGTGGNISLIPDSASILLNNVSWPDGSVTPSSGMFIGASGVNNLQFYPFVLGSSLSDSLTQSALNIAFPSAQPGQMVLGPTVVYVCVTSSTWRTLGTPTSFGAIVIKTLATDYTLQLVDSFNTLLRIVKATPAVVTIPNDATANLPIGSNVLIGWNGVGTVSVGFEAGVTVDTPDTYNIGKQYGKITAIKTGANHWEIEGNLEPF